MMSKIEKVAVLGAGLMGSGIAAHVANSGATVVLLDIVPQNAKNRNVLADQAIKKLLDSNPAALMHRYNVKNIVPGNLEDNLDLISDCDWICEAVLEDINIKHSVYRKIDKFRRTNSAVSSNTSTIPLSKLTEGMPKNFVSSFAITHFFNPPRYMPLLEVVAGPDTKADIVDSLRNFGDIVLGKEVVVCKDTPGFIANRIGVYWSMVAMQEAVNLGLTIEEADAIVGKPMGIPKTGIFGLMDLTGIDLKDHVLESMQNSLPASDAFYEQYDSKHPLNALTDKMIADGYTGRKGKGGFYRIVKKNGKKKKEVIDLDSGLYRDVIKPSFESIVLARKGLQALVECSDKGGLYARLVLTQVLKYAADLVPEISDDIVSVDTAMKAGYAWKYGPFEQIDQLGTQWLARELEKDNREVPEILKIADGRPLYREKGKHKQCLAISGNYQDIPTSRDAWSLADRKRGCEPIASNRSASIWDIGDGVACLEFHSKMNAIDTDIIAMVKEAAKLDRKNFKALVVGNDGKNFSAGANIGLALFAANAAMWPVLEQTIKEGQDAYLALKYSPIPVVAAPAGMALGGGCEICLHSDAIQCHAELYMGLVEVGVGLIPGWGGTKEMVMRHFQKEGRPGGPVPPVIEAFQTIGLAKVSKSAAEARDLLFLRENDGISMNRKRLLSDAKKKALGLSKDYHPPPRDLKISLPGPSAKIALQLAVKELVRAGKATEHDSVVSIELAHIVSGGETDLTDTIGEKDLLSLERKSMAKLFRESRTLDRIEYMLQNGKPLRN